MFQESNTLFTTSKYPNNTSAGITTVLPSAANKNLNARENNHSLNLYHLSKATFGCGILAKSL